MAATEKLNHAVALEVKDLHKRFGPLEVLRGVSLTAGSARLKKPRWYP